MSEIVTIEPPQDRAVTLEEARQQLRLDGRAEDLLLGAKLDAAQAELEQQTGLKLCEQTLELQLESWSQEITVPVRPCVVADIRYVRRQNIWRSSRRRLAECGPRLGLDFRRRACGVASAYVRWSVA